MRTNISSISALKELFVEILLSKTSKVSKISDGSVLSGISYGVAKLGQKAQKDVALLESRIFPSDAYGSYLDDIANDSGISPRFSVLGSSVYLLIQAAAGTQYLASTHVFTGSHDIQFILSEDFTMPDVGYAYVLARSSTTGIRTNVDPYTINRVNPSLTGHISVTNEFRATGGRETETDDEFRARIMSHGNLYSMGNLARLTQLAIKNDSRVLRLFNYGRDDSGRSKLGVLLANGAVLSPAELLSLESKLLEGTSLTDSAAYGRDTRGICLSNIVWHDIDVDFRVSLTGDVEAIRRSIQVEMSRYINYTKWTASSRIEWYDLFAIVRVTQGVKYCSDTHFLPRVDIVAPYGTLPRFRKFIMRNASGAILYSDELQKPFAFPNYVDASYQTTVLLS